MKLEEACSGDKVCLTLHFEGKKMPLESTVINVIDNSLVVNPFLVNGAFLDIPSKVDVEMMLVHQDDVPHFWQKVSVVKKIYHEKDCHVITSKLPGVRMNRRSNFRVFMGFNGKLTGLTEHPLSITVKDVSSSGFAILTDKNTQIELHKKITIEYSDPKFKMAFELAGRPIRRVELEHNMLYGCILANRYPELGNYLSQKQMEHRPNAMKRS